MEHPEEESAPEEVVPLAVCEIEMEIDGVNNRNENDASKNLDVSSKKKSLKIVKRAYKARFQANWSKNYSWIYKVTGDDTKAGCSLCKTEFSVASIGQKAVTRHASNESHLKHVDNHKKQATLGSNMNTNTVKVVPPDPVPDFQIDTTLRATIIWALKVVSSNYSFASCDDIAPVLRMMFPDSEIVTKIQMARTKITYLLNFGIAEYIILLLKADAQNTVFGYAFDETTTTQKKKQYDSYIRYNSKRFKKIVTRYFSSEMVGHCNSDHLTDLFFKKNNSIGLDLNYLLQVGMDGPNTNHSFFSKASAKIKKDFNKELIDIGTCCLHPIHTGFIKALKCVNFEYEDFVQDIYSFFKFSVCRTEDFMNISSITEQETQNMLRHVQSRWLSLRPVLTRIDEQWDNLVQYFLKELPKDKNAKNTLESARYQRIKSVLECPCSRIAINFAIFVAKILEDLVLRPFQSKSPNIHLLYPALGKLLYSLMTNFIPKNLLKTTDAFELSKLDCESKALLAKSINFGRKVEVLIESMGKMSQRQSLAVDKLKTEMRSSYIKLVQFIQSKLPIKSLLVKNAVAIDPRNKFDKSTEKSLKYLADKIGHCIKNTLKCSVESYVDKVIAEFQLYLTDNSFNDEYERLDEYYWRVHDSSKKYHTFCDLAFNILTLSVANVPAEQGFSINKDFLEGRFSLSEKSVISLRLTKDALLLYDNKVTNFPIDKELLTFCTKAYNRYEADLKSKKDADELEKKEIEKRNKEKDRQRQKEALDDLKKKQKEIKLKLSAANNLLDMGHEKVNRGSNTNNMGIVIDGNSNIKEAKKRIAELQLELKNLESS